MPFVPKENREIIDKYGLSACKTVGDMCYYYYKDMVKQWKECPRWTTAHLIYKNIYRESYYDLDCAQQLAWQVFFQTYVMPYEYKKRKENGDII